MMRGLRAIPTSAIYNHCRPPSLNCSNTSFRCGLEKSKLGSRAYATAAPSRLYSRTRNILAVTLATLGLCLSYFYVTDTRASIHRWLAVPLIRVIWPDAEDAHEVGTHSLKALYRFGLYPRERGRMDRSGDLQTDVFGYTLDNPLGISSGLDKHADVPTPLLALGPAVVEIGGVTPHPQKGNPKPRVFRVESQQALINRYGLNSLGAEMVAARLQQRVREYAYENGYGIDEAAERFVLDGDAGVPPGSLVKGKLLAVQVAKQGTTPDGDIDAVREDYVFATKALARYADIIVVNVSCPNAPGYRELQKTKSLTNIMTGVVAVAKQTDRKVRPIVMVKVSPDQNTEEEVTSICAAVWATGVDGVITGNTTLRRPSPLLIGKGLSRREAAVMSERGGYSGPQMFERTLDLVRKYRRILDQGASLHAAGTQGETKSKADASVKHDEKFLKNSEEDASAQPLIRFPERHSSNKDISKLGEASTLSASHHVEQGPEQKVIFCTGSITSGHQALQVLAAGASVAQIYTAMVYGGVGHITRMKKEMREELRESLKAEVLNGKET